MKTKEVNPGDKVKLRTSEKTWQGTILESYDPSIILLKLSSGYNIGLRESTILDIKVIEKSKAAVKEKQEQEHDKKLPNVAMIITGGTISSRLDPKTGAVISTDEEEILNIAPELSKICNITKIEKPFQKFSEDMSFIDWKKLAETCKELLDNKEIDGIIITHGTDFLHYTSSALSFYLRDLTKPIALTYSQRSIDRGSTDAALNLICSARYAISDIAEVAIVGHKNLNDNICVAMPGTKVRKMHTSRRDTFKTINSTPIVEITDDLNQPIKILKDFNARVSDKDSKLDAQYSDKVSLIQVHPGQDPNILEFYANAGYKGIIIELSGLGHLPGKEAKFNWLPTITKLIKKGITICATPQTLYGRLNPNVYSAGRELQKTGIIFLEDMLPETAFVKLSWILGHKTWKKEKIKEKLLENISNEFSKDCEDGFEF
jgi:glutamyl-tRNA(Gln) amidotransferase subunit D